MKSREALPAIQQRMNNKMPPSNTERADLIARVEAATGGDRELDALIFRAVGAPLPEQFANLKLALEWQPDGTATMPVGEMQVRYEPPNYTSSVDAALALIERMLPGWGFYLRRDKDGCGAGLTLPNHTLVTPCHVEASSPALALILALLKALDGSNV